MFKERGSNLFFYINKLCRKRLKLCSLLLREEEKIVKPLKLPNFLQKKAKDCGPLSQFWISLIMNLSLIHWDFFKIREVIFFASIAKRDVQCWLDCNLLLKSNLTYLIIYVFPVILTCWLFSSMKKLVWCQGFYQRTPLWIIASGSSEKAYSNKKGDNMDFSGLFCVFLGECGEGERSCKKALDLLMRMGKNHGSEFIKLDNKWELAWRASVK